MSNPNRVALAGNLPAGGLNGLEAHHDDLLKDQKRIRLLVALIDVSGDSSNNDRDERWPVIRFRHVELITDDAGIAVVTEALASAMATRAQGDLEAPLWSVGEVAGPPEKKTRKPKDDAEGGGEVRQLRPGADGSGRQ